ncbi:MAG: sulfite exporter TauE/SafE family protein [Solidesulfovibrio sp. DCME]|uniref:sulfite exporter TauE/SafE family protein n=1 Tax=Solidesulfovibrio sp. DCME TaxID=3447380 RepID=UPI003D141C96
MATAHLVTLSLAAFLGGFTQGLTGFGSTLLALPLLALVMDLRLATPVCCLLAVTINVVLVSRLFGHIRWRALLLLFGASLPGVAVGARALGAVPGDWLKLAMAAVVLSFVALSLRPARVRGRPGRGLGLAAGFAAGCMGAAIGVNGPIVAMWVLRQGYDRDSVRATLTSFFLLAGFGVVGAQSLVGLVTPEVLSDYLVALPALLGGIGLGMAGCGRLGEGRFTRVVLVVLALSGTSILLQGAWGLARATGSGQAWLGTAKQVEVAAEGARMVPPSLPYRN